MTMQALMIDWFRRAAKQADALGYGNTAAMFTRTWMDLKQIPEYMFIFPPALVKAMNLPQAEAQAVAIEAVADQAKIDEIHAQNAVEGEKLVISGPPSTAPAAPAPDSPKVQPPAEVVEAAQAAETPTPLAHQPVPDAMQGKTVEEMAAKFAAPAPDAKP